MKTTCLIHRKDRNWYIVDAKDQALGRISTHIARILNGKHLVNYTPSCDCGDYVVVTNASQFKVTGSKMSQKYYFTHSGYLGGEKKIILKNMVQKHPLRIMQLAVQGMLPKNKLRKNKLARLKLYTGTTHPHTAQNPQPLITNH